MPNSKGRGQDDESLSSWRAWIEIAAIQAWRTPAEGRSPHGERGLKWVTYRVVHHESGRSPHGERGLKSKTMHHMFSADSVALLMESVD